MPTAGRRVARRRRGYERNVEPSPSRLATLEIATALHRGITMVRCERSHELSDESRALRAAASITYRRSVALLHGRRRADSAE